MRVCVYTDIYMVMQIFGNIIQTRISNIDINVLYISVTALGLISVSATIVILNIYKGRSTGEFKGF